MLVFSSAAQFPTEPSTNMAVHNKERSLLHCNTKFYPSSRPGQVLFRVMCISSVCMCKHIGCNIMAYWAQRWSLQFMRLDERAGRYFNATVNCYLAYSTEQRVRAIGTR